MVNNMQVTKIHKLINVTHHIGLDRRVEFDTMEVWVVEMTYARK